MADSLTPDSMNRRTPARGLHLLAGLLLSWMLSTAPVMAFDNGIQFGPSGQGVTNPGAVDREFVREWKKNPPPGYPTLSPQNVGPTKAAIKKYEAIVASGGWETVPAVKMFYGETHFAVAVLKRRLTVSGELPAGGDESEYFGSDLDLAVKRFQATNGLTPTGIVDERTAAALNVSAEARLRQLKNSLARLKEYAGSTAKQKYVVVNIPAAQVEAVQGDKVVSRHTGVVGKPERPFTYLTAWATPDGVIQFRRDLYDRDRSGSETATTY